MNKHILALASFSIFLFGSNQLISMQPTISEHQLQLNEQLVSAAISGYKDTIISLLGRGADVNYANNGGYTALEFATFNNNIEIVQLLLERGADVNRTNNYGNTILSMAAERGHTAIVNVLIKAHGVNVNHANIYGHTALMLAAITGNREIVKLLIEHGARVNYTNNKDGNTALHLGARNGNISVIKLLLSAGAHLDIKNHNGYTAWGLADSQSKLSNGTKSGELLARVAQFLERNAAQTILWNVTRAGRHEGRLGDLPAEVTAHIASYVMVRDNHGQVPHPNGIHPRNSLLFLLNPTIIRPFPPNSNPNF